MRKLLVFLFCVMLYAISGEHFVQIELYESPEGGAPVWSHDMGIVTFGAMGLDPDPMDALIGLDLGYETLYFDLKIDGIQQGERIEVSMRPALRRELEPMDEMDIGLAISNPGEEIRVLADRTVMGTSDPNERLSVDGAVSLQKTETSPTATSGFGKIFVNSADGHLYYMDESGDATDLTVDGSAVQSVSSSANTEGRTDHMRFIPGAGTDITESATNDTIYIRYDLSTTGSPCESAPAAPATLDGSVSVCSGEPGASYAVAPVDGATYYRWTYPEGATVIDGLGTNIIRAVFGNIDGNICIQAVNDCGSSSATCLAVSINRPTTPGSISGYNEICEHTSGVTYMIDPVPDADNYIWTVPAGALVASGAGTHTITVNFGSPSGDICVTTENDCGRSEPTCMSVTVYPVTLGGAVSGGTTPVCLGSSTGSMSVGGHEGTVLEWQRRLDSGSWVDIPHTATSYSEIPVSAGTWEYRALVQSGPCSSAYSSPQAIVVTPLSVGGAVTGGTTPICLGSSTGTMTLSGHLGSVSRWEKRVDGGTWTDISTTSSTYSEVPSSAGIWDYRAVVQNGPCSSANSSLLSISVADGPPSMPGTISGPTSVVPGTSQSYSITPVVGATSYVWTAPSGSSVSGTGTSVTVTFGATGGDVSVYAVNVCGNSGTQSLWINILASYCTTPGCGSRDGGAITPTTSSQYAYFSAGTPIFFKFFATAGRTYNFSLCHSSEDTYLYLYNSSCALVTSNDDSGPHCGGGPSSLAWYCSSSGGYTVTVARCCGCASFSSTTSLRYWYSGGLLRTDGGMEESDEPEGARIRIKQFFEAEPSKYSYEEWQEIFRMEVKDEFPFTREEYDLMTAGSAERRPAPPPDRPCSSIQPCTKPR